jgi:hypothetical protein
MFDWLQPRDGPVFDGFESKEVIYAKHQPQYNPLRSLVSADHTRSVISRWTLTPEQRKAVADGADVILELATFGHPLTPIRVAVSDGNISPDFLRDELNVDITPPRVQCPADKMTDKEVEAKKAEG